MARLPAAGVLLCLWTTLASAQTNYSYTFPVNRDVPDDSFSGLAVTTNLTGMSGAIGKVTVTLDISGGYDGDLYAYLRGPEGGLAVLLNRVGVTAGDTVGYGDTGFDITFDDSLSYDNIHFYQNTGYGANGDGQVTGTWSSDGRNIDPQSAGSAFDAAGTGANLSLFNGANADGDWTLFIADLNGGGQSAVVSWGLTIVTVPEPGTWVMLTGGAVMLTLLGRNRGIKQQTESSKTPGYLGRFESSPFNCRNLAGYPRATVVSSLDIHH